jgi:BASS family bile acid:Na+ symporter
VGLLVLLSVGPLLVGTALAWAIGRAFDGAVRDGVLGLGLSSTEVASVGLVVLAGGDAVLALGALAGSLVASAVLGPLLAGALASGAGHAAIGPLLGRFGLVVLVPLAAGLAVRARLPALERGEGALGGLSAAIVCVLVYAALSGVSGGGSALRDAALASLAFLAASAVLALGLARLAAPAERTAVGLATGLRDFAVAATLATQAFGPAAAGVAGVYGVLMLVAGALAATALRRRARAGEAVGAG